MTRPCQAQLRNQAPTHSHHHEASHTRAAQTHDAKPLAKATSTRDALTAMPAIHTQTFALPHGISLSCRVAGQPGRPVLMFLHGFPEAAFVWDRLLEHFSEPAHGAYLCIAPNLRGYIGSSAPTEISAYHPRHLVADIVALTRALGPQPLAALVAHDWGGAIAWNLAAQHPQGLSRLVILNAPHPATFARELAHSPAQQEASAYMHFLARPDAPIRLAEQDFKRLWALFDGMGASSGPMAWLDEAGRQRYREVWRAGLSGPCAYYAATTLKPPAGAPQAARSNEHLGRVSLPTQLIWGMKDTALLPGLLDGLTHWVPQLELHQVAQASHWIVHEQPGLVIERIAEFLAKPAKLLATGDQ
jgi:pimeloyl-ACP methyl ester carboxylesterase